MVEMAMFNVQKAETPNVGKQELLFMSLCRLIVLYICVKFCENTELTLIYYVPRAATPKVG